MDRSCGKCADGVGARRQSVALHRVKPRLHLLAHLARCMPHGAQPTPAVSAMSSSTVAEPTTEPQPAREQPVTHQGPRTLADAVAAVTEHCIRTEMQRLRRAYAAQRRRLAARTASTTPDAPARPQASQVLNRLLDGGALMLLSFDSAAPHAVREWSAAADDGPLDVSWRGRPLPHCFVADDALRLQRALLAVDSDLTMTVELRGGAAAGQRHLLHLLPPEPSHPERRWACLMRLPHDQYAPERSTRRAIGKPALRPRLEAWPLQSL